MQSNTDHVLNFKHTSEVTSTNEVLKMNHRQKCFTGAKREWHCVEEELKALFKSIPNLAAIKQVVNFKHLLKSN